MATSVTTPEDKLITALGKLHPDYTVEIHTPINEVYPYITVTDGKKVVNTQIRLARNHWSVKVINRLVEKAIEWIETATPKKEEV